MGSLDYVSRLRSLDLFSIKGRLLRLDLIQVWKSFHMEVDLGSSGVFKMARDVGQELRVKPMNFLFLFVGQNWEGESLESVC